MKKTVIAFAALVPLILSVLVSCSGNKFGYSSVRKSDGTHYDYGGKTAVILTDSSLALNMGIGDSEDLPESVNDEILYRNRDTEISLGCVLDIEKSGSVTSEIRKRSNSGSSSSDIAILSPSDAAVLALDGKLLNLRSLSTLDLDRDCWDSSFLNSSTDGQKVYFALGDIDISHYRQTYVTFVNAELLGDSACERLLELSANGGFTLDVLNTYSAEVFGNGGPELFGYGSDFGDDVDAFFGGCGIEMTVFADGVLSASSDSDRVTEAYRKILNLVSEKFTAVSDGNESVDGMFRDGEVAFATLPLSAAEGGENPEFLILPMPKLDASQEDYRGYTDENCSVVAIPQGAEDAEFSGALTDTLCLRSARDVIPEYVKLLSNGKNTDSEEFSDAFEKAAGNITYNAAFIYSNCLGSGMSSLFSDGVRNGLTDIYDSYNAAIKTVISRLPEFNSAYSELE